MHEETTPHIAALSPWLPEARQRLAGLGLPPEWPEESVEAPSRRASQSADCTLRRLAELGLEPSWLAPCLEGGICIAFAFGERYADVQFLNSGEIVTTCAQETDSGPDLSQAFQTIRAYLAS